MKKNISIFFVASPLQILASRAIAQNFDKNRDHIIVYYKKNLKKIIETAYWYKNIYMPWPRYDPLPGFFGVFKRLGRNLELIDGIIDDCESLFFYSAVYDTEAINYFVSYIKKKFNEREHSFRIIPDGLISMQKNPLKPISKILKKSRNLRRLFNKNLVYTHFDGDRIGADADFIDLIYVLKGLPHQYDENKVKILPELVKNPKFIKKENTRKKVLIVGQPLKGFRLMKSVDIDLTKRVILRWISENEISDTYYKKHPKDSENTLNDKSFIQLEDDISIELHLAKNNYDCIIGVNSTALLLATQICPSGTTIISFGLEKVKYKSIYSKNLLKDTFENFGIMIKEI